MKIVKSGPFRVRLSAEKITTHCNGRAFSLREKAPTKKVTAIVGHFSLKSSFLPSALVMFCFSHSEQSHGRLVRDNFSLWHVIIYMHLQIKFLSMLK